MPASDISLLLALPQLIAQAVGNDDALFIRLMHAPMVVPVVAIVFGISCGIVATIVHYLHLNRVADIEASLKHSMLERGMSADEIERVLGAHIGGGGGLRNAWSRKSSSQQPRETQPLRQ